MTDLHTAAAAKLIESAADRMACVAHPLIVAELQYQAALLRSGPLAAPVGDGGSPPATTGAALDPSDGDEHGQYGDLR